MTKARDIADGGGGDRLGTVTANDVDLSTGNFFEITTNNQTLSFSNAPAVHDFKFKLTGASITTGFDISNGSWDGAEFNLNVSGQDTGTMEITFNNNGEKLYMIGESSDSVYQYTLTTAFDLSTASYDSVSLSVGSQDSLPTGLIFSNDGKKMFICGATNNTVYQYSTEGTLLSTITYPSSVKFPAATAPTTPANGEVDTIGIYTIDSGTSYYLYLVSDNQS